MTYDEGFAAGMRRAAEICEESRTVQRVGWYQADGGQDYAIAAQLADAAADRIELLTADLAATLARAERAEAECDKLSIALQMDAALLKEAQFERDNNRAKLEVKKHELAATLARAEKAEAEVDEMVAEVHAHIKMWGDACVAKAKAEDALAEVVEALRPFSKMAGEMFVRNWNDEDVAIALDNPEELCRLTFRDFRNLRAILARAAEKEGSDAAL